jgi:hypothetical protein
MNTFSELMSCCAKSSISMQNTDSAQNVRRLSELLGGISRLSRPASSTWSRSTSSAVLFFVMRTQRTAQNLAEENSLRKEHCKDVEHAYSQDLPWEVACLLDEVTSHQRSRGAFFRVLRPLAGSSVAQIPPNFFNSVTAPPFFWPQKYFDK